MMPGNEVLVSKYQNQSEIEPVKAQETTSALKNNFLASTRRVLARVGLATSLAISASAVISQPGEGVLEVQVAEASTGGYPDADAKDCSATNGQYSWCKNGTDISSRGFGYRNCTDWAAFRAFQLTGIKVPYGTGMGDARSWDDNAPRHGFSVDATPEPGDIAVWDPTTTNWWGHVAIVESVNSNGTVNISEYNGAGNGTYGTKQGVRASKYIDLNGVTSPEKISYAAVAEGQELYSDEGFVYTRVGGSAWPIKPKKDWNSGDKVNWGGDPVGPIPVGEVHDHEAGFGAANAHPPVDGTAVYQEGTGQQWYFTKGRAYPVGSGELDDLGIRNKAMRIPFGRLPGFEYGLVPMQDGDLYRYAGGATVRQFFTKLNSNVDASYWVNNETVLDCLEQTYGKRINVLPQSAKPYVGKGWGTTELSQPAACSYPSGMVLRGPGGIEQWRIAGNNSSQPYQRRYFPTSLITYLHTSGNPQNRVMRSTQALNSIPQGQDMQLPNGIFFVDKGNSAQFKVENGIFRPIPYSEMNKCLGNTNPVYVPGSVVGPIPQGSPMTCAFENRIFHRPDGRAYYVESGRKHYIGTAAIRDCISVRKNAGLDVEVSDGIANQYVDSSAAYCPYEMEPGLNFVQESNDPTVWLVNADGTKRHVGQNCVVDPYTTQHKKFRIHIVPNGETAGHTKTTDFFGNPTNCGQLPG